MARTRAQTRTHVHKHAHTFAHMLLHAQVPEVYKRSLQLLREADVSGRWPRRYSRD